MDLRVAIVLIPAMFLSACTFVDGVYLPACEAYAGSKISLADGRFQWSKFTDQVVVDDDGNTVDPFPGLPVAGDYQVDGKAVTLNPDTGQPAETLYFFEESGGVYLLTAREKAGIQEGGDWPKCALRRQSRGT